MAMFNPSRAEVREFFIETWRKGSAGLLLSPLETIAFEWMREHPEYHTLLAAVERALEADYAPEHGQTNPFLHLSMHLSISEQVSIDQPPGIRSAAGALAAQAGSLHEAHHRIMECLGAMLWKSQRDGAPPDAAAYLECVRRSAA